MMLMLTVARRVIWQHGNVSGGRWRGNGPAPRMYELYDKTLGIVGLGTIGKKVARLAQRLRHAGAVLRHRAAAPRTRRTRSACGSACCASCCAPPTSSRCTCRSTTSTRHMIGAAELALMKPTAIIVNTSRGPVIDEAALDRALADGQAVRRRPRRVRPGAAAADNPLFKLDNVVLTSHFAGPDLGQSRRALPQRLRQRAARRPRRAAAVGGAGAGRGWRRVA